MKKFKPLQDRILVKRLEEKETKKGGIIIPDTAKEKPQEGEVIAVGPGKVDGRREAAADGGQGRATRSSSGSTRGARSSWTTRNT